MIELVNVSKYYPTEFGRHYVFRDVNLVLPLDMSVGVIGPNGAGKSTFLRLIGGADIPSEGRILRSGRISPPMGLTPGIQANLTGGENARFACRIYGMSRDEMDEVVEKVRELAGIGNYFDMPVKTYSAGMRQRVAFAISMSLNFDYYLFDEIGAGGDRQFREVASKMIKERLATSKFIITSHRHDELINLCDAGIVIMGGELTYFPDIRDALAFYGEPIEESSEAKGKPAAVPKSSKAVKPAPPAEAPAPKVAAKVKAPKPGTATRAPRPGALAAATRPAAGANADQVLADFLKRRSTTAKAEAPAAEDSKPPPVAEAVRKPALAARRQKAQPPKSAALTAQDLAAIKASRALEQLLQIIDGKPTHGSDEEHHEAIARTRTAQTQAAAAAARARIAAAAESVGHSNPSAPPPPRGQRPDGIPARNQNQDRRRARRAQAAAPAGRIEAGTDRP